MPRARRLVSLVAVAALAVSGLAACRSAPDAVAYFGNAKVVSEAEVQQVWDDTAARLQPDPQTGQKHMPFERKDITNLLIRLEALRVVGKDQGLTVTAQSAAEIAQSLNLSPDAELVGLAAEFQAWVTLLKQKATPATVTDEDMRAVFQRLQAGGPLPGNPTFEQFSASITEQDKQSLAPSIGLRNALQPRIDALNIKVNPRYPVPDLPLYSVQGPKGEALPLIGVTFGTAGGDPVPVTDLA
ncbi:hypothetical protein [Krasilnikovia sp. M28-CT-15]|uniref:hypothetical protein n=1 Tax=Krasilnikovia sp. M28-CT-15 TaxID=3373540 RepID=UPI003876BC81